MKARDQRSSRPLTMSVSKSTLGLEGSEWDSIIAYSPSSSPPTSMPIAQIHVKSKVVRFRKVKRRSSSPGHARRGKARTWWTNRPFRRRSLHSAGMLKRGGGVRDEDEAGAGVRGMQGSKDLGDVRKGEERWYNR